MPKWGIEMREGTVAEWLVAEGAAFARGDMIALIETDKITNEVEAEFAATLARIVVPAGEVRALGALLGVFADGVVETGEVDAFVRSFGGAGAAATSSAAAVPGKAEADAPTPSPTPDDGSISPTARALATERGIDPSAIAGSGRGGRITHQDVAQAARPPAAPALGGPLALHPEAPGTPHASPSARRAAAEHGVDLANVPGTGRRGRIGKADVLVRVPATPGAAQAAYANPPQIVAMTKYGRVAARRLTEAKATIPHFYLRAEVRVDALLALREAANTVLGAKASVNDFLVRAAALALVASPSVNIQVHGTDIHRFPHADIAVAVATDAGLLTPIVRGADLLTAHAIGSQVRALAERARAGRLGYDELEGGSFTVSNLGMFGVDQFDAIINPPQGAIVAVGAARRVWGEDPHGQGRFETRLALSLSCDHRAIDGATGAAFLAKLKALIEAPAGLFAR